MELLSQLSGLWWAWMGPMLQQSTVLVAIVGVSDLLIGRWVWPQVRRVLWLLVVVKLLLPPAWSLPTGIVPRLERRLPVRIEAPWTAPSRGTPFGTGPNSAFSPLSPDVAKSRADAGDGPAVAGAPTPAGPSRGPAFDWRTGAFVVWLAGLSAFVALLLRRFAALRRWHDHERRGQTIPAWYYELLVRTAGRLKLGRLPAIVFSDRLLTPAVCGVVRPVMYLPRDYTEKLTPGEAEHVLLHELAHIKRGDLWIHAAGLLVQVVYWFNPLVALARRQLQHVGEICTDLAVAAVLRERTAEYRQTLLDTASRLLTESAAPGLGLLGVFEEPFRLVARLRWLDRPRWRHRIAARATSGAVAAAMLVFVLPMADGAPRAGSPAGGVVADAAAAGAGDFVHVGPGTFTMGSPADELGRYADEVQHRVTLTRGFNLQSTEVTNRQYLDLMQWAFDRGYVAATEGAVLDRLDGSRTLLLRVGPGSEFTFSGGVFACVRPECPARSLTWYGAAAFCDWLSLRQGLPRAYDHATWQCNGGDPYAAAGYRLPTEAEWEYACRAGTATAFASGPITRLACAPLDSNLDEMGWYCGNAGDAPAPVGRKLPNAWGLYDMHGNVYEWCNDWGTGTFAATATDPAGPAQPTAGRVARGGNYVLGNGAEFCRSALRNWFPPERIGFGTGCRVVRSAAAERAAQAAAPPDLAVLSPPSPNPFNPRTAVRFSLSRTTRVTLAVHDVRGARVRTLLDDAVAAGERSVEWDGCDDGGAAVAAGVYLVRLETAEGVVRVQKMALAR